MIQTEQTVAVAASIDQVWDYVRTIRNWAELMPGFQDCDIQNEDDSVWTLKVGVGALVRTVKVQVHVDEWSGPKKAVFHFKLLGDPVEGRGSFHAQSIFGSSTEMTFHLEVNGSGPMAPMWEAMGAPLLPKFALSFAEQLAQGIERNVGAQTTTPRPVPDQPSDSRLSWWARLRAWFCRSGSSQGAA